MDAFPERIGKYTIVGTLGEGASARVLLGHDSFSDAKVAIKLFHGSGPDAGPLSGMDRSAFLNEAKLVGKMHHPHIVAMLDAVAEGSQAYLVMEHLAGGTLAKYASQPLLPIEQVLEVVFKISRALEYAHQHGVVHRDLKPSNILMTETEDVKLSDFGIAMLSDATHTQILHAGTPSYMAPEQLSNAAPTQQSDIYSMGVVMYQLLTGRLPFSASSQASLMYQIVNHEPPPPSAFRHDLPEALEAVVLRAMQRDVEARYRSWHEFGLDLAALTAGPAPSEHLSDARLFQALRGFAFFRDFGDVEVWEFLRLCRRRSFEPGELVIREGERGDSVFFLIEGEVNLTRGGRQLTRLASGDCFGVMLYFDGTTIVRPTTIETRLPVHLVEVKAEDLARASDRCQMQFNKGFTRILVARLEEATQRLANAGG